jgi:hypothetical protein
MPRNQETTNTGDQVQPSAEDWFRAGTTDPAGRAPVTQDPDEPDATGDQPGVPAADVIAAPADAPLPSGPADEPLAAGLARRPLMAVPDTDAAAREEDRRLAGSPADTGSTESNGVPPVEGEWVAGPRGPGHAAAAPGLASASPAPGQPEPTEPREPLESPAQPGTPAEAAPAPGGSHAGAGAPLLTDQDGLRARWLQIQFGFIDDPRASVAEAAGFVGEVTSMLMTAVQDRERSLRGAWDSSGDPDTEKLRNVLREYRSFFEFLTRL